MTALPDPSDLAPSRDPAAYARRRLFSVGFWAMMALCLGCVLAGAALVKFAPMFAGPPPHAAATPAAVVAATGAAPSASQLPTPAAPTQASQAAAAAVSTLTDRVQRLESGQTHALDAATQALAASALADAAAQPRPFADELAAFEHVLPYSPDARALRPLAAQGAPTRAALAADLSRAGADAAVAARRPDRNAGFLANLGYAISRVVSVRRIDGAGSSTDAALARAEAQAADGDLDGAIRLVDGLPPSARDALASWRAKAQRRLEIDRHIASLRAQALGGLTAFAKTAP